MDVIKEWSQSEVEEIEQQLLDSILQKHANTENLALVAIANGGIALCDRLAAKLAPLRKLSLEKGLVDISFYRDDIGKRPFSRAVTPTDLPFDVDDATIILIDDVLFSGRTVRAAMTEVFDLGRPAAVELGVLFDRQNYRLPIRPDHVGISYPTDPSDKVQVLLNQSSPEEDRIILSTLS